MASEDVDRPAAEEAPNGTPRRLLLIGLGMAAAGFLCFRLPQMLSESASVGGFWTFLWVVLLVGGAIVTGSAVALRPRWVPGLLASAGIAWLIGTSMDPDWDSARRVMLVLTTVALAAALLLALPYLVGRLFVGCNFLVAGRSAEEAENRGNCIGWVLGRAVVSLLVVLHFVGIVAVVLAASAGGREPSWLARWVSYTWAPYTEFCYLENSYRFYSPEPGPPTLMWCFVTYSDGSGQWIKLPDREEHAKDLAAQEFTRRLSLGESITHGIPLPSIPEPILTKRCQKNLPPLHPEVPLLGQYQVPNPLSQRNIAEYARYVAKHYPHDDPRLSVKGVKVYRVLHNMLSPQLMATGRFTPTEPWTYWPYFMGEYDETGAMMDEQDPLLYWLIPIYPWPHDVPRSEPFSTTGNPLPLEVYPELDVYDYLKLHAVVPPKWKGR